MKYIKCYEKLKFNQKHYGIYDLINLVRQRDLGNDGENKMIDIIKSGQVDLNVTDIEHKTALIWSMINRYNKVFDTLIDVGANLDIPNENGSTPLILAAIGTTGGSFEYFKDKLEKLIISGADWNKEHHYQIANNHDFLHYLTDKEFKNHILKKYHIQYEMYLLKKETDKYNI